MQWIALWIVWKQRGPVAALAMEAPISIGPGGVGAAMARLAASIAS